MMNLSASAIVLITFGFFASAVSENDENERILCSTADDTYTKIFSISENSANGTLIGTLDVQGTSAPGDGKDIELALLEGDDMQNCGKDGKTCLSWLQLDPLTKSLHLRVEPGFILDRDGPDGVQAINVMLNCTVTVGREMGQQVQMAISVIVDDVNDNPPVFEADTITTVVSELLPVNSTVAIVEASDNDKISKRTYSLLPTNDSHYFYIEAPHAGVILLKEKLDYEKLVKTSSILFFTVLVEDEGSGGIIRNATVNVEVTVDDGDDLSPVFLPCVTVGKLCVSPEYTARVARDANPGEIITSIQPGKIDATDPDVDLLVSSEIRYSLLASPADRLVSTQYFSVGEEDGVLSIIDHLPPKDDHDEYNLYIKAAQVNNEEAFQVTRLTVKVVDKVTDVYAPEFSHKNLQGFVHAESESEVLFVRNVDGTLLRLMANDRDYVNTNRVPALKYESVNLSSLFEITDDGFIIYKRYNDALINGFPFVLSVRVTNPEAAVEFTKSSATVRVTIESNNIYEECNVLGCGVKKSDTEQQLVSVAAVAVLGSFLVLAVLAAIVLLTLVVKYRKKREALGKKSLVASVSTNSKYHGLGFSNTLGTSLSGSSSASSRMISKPVLSQTSDATVDTIKSKQPDFSSTPSKKYVASSRKTKAQNVTDESPSIAPYDTHHRFVSDSTNTSLYTSNNDLDGWAAFSTEESLHFEQLSLTEQTAQSKHKMFYKGHIALSDTLKRDCFVTRYSGTYSHKDSMIQDLWAMQEILNVKSCTHVNLVKFYGCCSNKESLYVVTEMVSSANDLRSTLRSSRMEDHAAVISSFSGTQLANFSTAIADGLQYLHTNAICHGNICARTILLSDHLIPKLRGCCGRKNSRLRKKTLRWAAPEIVTGNPYTTASDVWAYAVVVWEILTLGGLPYWTIGEKNLQRHLVASYNSNRLEFPVCRNAAKRFWVVLQNCWQVDPPSRPGMSEVIKRIARMRSTITPITVARPPGYEFVPTTVRAELT